MTTEIICDDTPQIVCPYCGCEHTDSWKMCDEEYGYTQRVVCICCDKSFMVRPESTTTYYSNKADCLNGGEHDWSEWRKAIPSLLLREERQCRGCSIREQRNVE